MVDKRRDSTRTNVKGLQAKVILTESNRSVLAVEANILDISQSGIKIRVQKPLIIAIGKNIQLEVFLPKTGDPVIVNTVVVREKFDSEFGLHYIDLHPEDPLEKLISECESMGEAPHGQG